MVAVPEPFMVSSRPTDSHNSAIDKLVYLIYSLPSAMENKTSPVTVRDVPVELWQQFKSTAALKGETIKVAVTKALQQYVSAA